MRISGPIINCPDDAGVENDWPSCPRCGIVVFCRLIDHAWIALAIAAEYEVMSFWTDRMHESIVSLISFKNRFSGL